MKFKLIEKFDETRSMVQEYMYDAMDELNNASLDEYIQWFKSELTYYDDEVERAVKDAYIEACDYGMIKGVEKTRLTSELKEYIESHTDIIDDTDEFMRQCPEHLQHELKIVLSKLDESLNESVLEEAIRPDLKRFIEQHVELLDENNIEELYKQCPRELKIPLVRMLNRASLSDNIKSIKRATYLADFYDDDELINLVLSVGEHANDVFDAFDYIMNNWDKFFDDGMLNEELLTEGLHSDLRNIATLMRASGYSNIVMDRHTNKIVGDKANKTYLFEVIFDQVNSRLNDRFYVNYADSVNKDKEVHLQPVAPVGASVGKAGVGHKRSENRRQYIDKIFIWELKYLSDASDPTTWP